MILSTKAKEKPMKRLAFVFILVFSLLLLAGCADDKYAPIESSEEETQTIITLKIENKDYAVRYELYRAFFLNYKSSVDGGNSEVWSGDEASKYIDKINELIINDAVEIFSTLHLANKIGYDPYSDKADYDVEELFKADIESFDTNGNMSDEEKYDAFLNNLKSNNLNYSVADLLYRYALASAAVDDYYRTEYTYSREDVQAYYNSDNCARIMQAYFHTGVKSYSEMQSYREELAKIDNELSLAVKIIGTSSVTETDIIDGGELSGIMIGKQELSQRKYSSYVNEIFSISDGELSEIITLENTRNDGYYLIYRLEKSDEHFEAFYPAIANSYLDNVVGGILGGMENELAESKSFTNAYRSISHKYISMN